MIARLCAIVGAVAIALSACTQRPAPPPPPVVVIEAPPEPVAGNPTNADRPEFLRLPSIPAGVTPVRVGIILPLSNSNAATRQLAQSMLKAAQMALFDARNPNIMLISADEGATPNDAAAAATRLLNQGAEIILGPLFATSVAAIAPLARDRAVPVLAFSTTRSVAGQGTYLLSFLPQDQVRRIISYAAQQGRKSFAGLIPQDAGGDVAAEAFQQSVAAANGSVTILQRFAPSANTVVEPATAVAKVPSDAIFIPQGGVVLRTIAPTLGFNGVERNRTKLLGTGLWDDPTLQREPMLTGAWFAAPEPNASDAFNNKYRATFGSAPANLATLSYDAMSLVALLSGGIPYRRFTTAALTDPNGFGGVDGIFRFLPDGTSERGLAVLEIGPNGFTVVSPAPRSFIRPGS
jgi:ABC-type branched-subunit amino acid transport system substrate-binding protein